MAVKTIAELSRINSIAENDLLVIDDGSRNFAITWANLKAALGTVSSFTVDNTAGTITITLVNGTTLTVTPHDPTKQDTLLWDTTPTAGSTKPVTSDGIKDALDGKLDAASYTHFTGATDSTAGIAGIVPAPAAGMARYLSSEGTWITPANAPIDGSKLLITSDAVFDALLVIATDIAPTYSSSATYSIGSYVTHDNILYRCTTAITTAEEWSAAHWTAAQLTEDTAAAMALKLDTANVYNGTDKTDSGYALDARQGKALLDRINVLIGLIASEYSDQATYIVDDIVIYQNNLYRCITAITTAEVWTAAHWKRTTISHELAYKLTCHPVPDLPSGS